MVLHAETLKKEREREIKIKNKKSWVFFVLIDEVVSLTSAIPSVLKVVLN